MGIWNIDNGPALATKFFYVGGRLFAFAVGDGLYERTGAGIWAICNVGLVNLPEDVTYWASTWWAACADGVYSATDPALGWTLRWVRPLPPPILISTSVAGYGSYLYVSVMELVGFVTPTIHFLRYSVAGGWEYDFIASYTNPNGLGFTLQYSDLIYYDSLLWWSVNEQGTGYVFRYHDGAAWADYTSNLEIGRFLHITGDGMYFVSCSLDQVWRNAGAGWQLMYDCPDDIYFVIGLSEGDDDSLWFGADDGAGNMRAHAKQGGVWGPATSTVADAWVGGAIQVGGDIFMGGNINVWLYAPDFAITPIGGGLYPQAMDCDGDGNALYVGVYNAAAQPVLVKVPLPLTPTAMGAAVFNPGVGSAINVKCSAVGQKLAISGRLSAGGNDSVQTSEDGGGTWTDIAPAWADTAQPLLVDSDGVDEVYVALDAAQDLDETVDGGTTWIQRNAAVGYSPGAMAKLPDGDELVAGNDAGNRIDYSPNRGQTLTNITGIFAGNIAALEVV